MALVALVRDRKKNLHHPPAAEGVERLRFRVRFKTKCPARVFVRSTEKSCLALSFCDGSVQFRTLEFVRMLTHVSDAAETGTFL